MCKPDFNFYPANILVQKTTGTFKCTPDSILLWKQTIWTRREQSDPGPYCLQYRPPTYSSQRENKGMLWIAGKGVRCR